MKRTLRAISLSACAVSSALMLSAPAEARIVLDALGGEVEINGFLSSEARVHTGSGETYVNQWIQRLQIEASANYKDVGVFDTFSLVTVIRPEFDAAYYYGDSIADDHQRGGTKPSYLGQPFTAKSDPVGFGGFDYVGGFFGGNGQNTFSTGGVGKIVSEGLQPQSWIDQNFETILNRTPQRNRFSLGSGVAGESGFPLFAIKSGFPLSCQRCSNLNTDELDIAMGNNDSNRRIYPFRELYMDATIGDWWLRVGKQQIVWGKTDFFRLQDIVNPIDFGQHFFFDSFEDIRIPQWMASVQYKAGDIGPTTDNAIQFVWNFDRFEPVGLGNAGTGWAHPFAKQKTTFAGFNTFFSVEPCLGPASLGLLQNGANNLSPSDYCGSGGANDRRLPSGFGQPVGLNFEEIPEWKVENTEGGARWEFRMGEVHFAITDYYGHNDVPVFRFHSINVPNAILGVADVPNFNNPSSPAGPGTQDFLVYDLICARNPTGLGCTTARTPGGPTPAAVSGAFAGFGGAAGFIPVRVVDPAQGIAAAAAAGNAAAQAAIAQDNATIFYNTGLVLGGQTDIQYEQANTTGLSFDYFESLTGTVLRVESSWTINELVNNTRKANWIDHSDVMRWSIGIDRPTWIKWLNKDRTFFLSAQLFDTWYWDHEGDKHTGYYVDAHNFISTFFFIANYFRDTVTPIGFIVWEEASNSWVAGFNTEWKMNNHWSVKGGLHTIWGGTGNFRHDSGPFRSFVVPGANGNDPFQQSVFGVAHEGVGALRDNDELFFQLKYQF